ncbi:hypothetical protein [Streptomyces smyrnaeus]
MIRTHCAAVAVLTAALLTPTAAACASAERTSTADARPAASAATAANSDSRLSIPRPTGEWAVGRDTLPLVDHDRRDPWVPSAGARRVMVSVLYPRRLCQPRKRHCCSKG